METVIRQWALLLFFSMAGCTNFSALHKDMQESRSQLGRIAGEALSESCPDCPIVLVTLEKPDSAHVHTYRVYERAGAFSLFTRGVSRYLFAFNDLNNDFQFQESEPHAWLRLPESFGAGAQIENLKLTLTTRAERPLPAFGNLFDLRGADSGSIDVQLGTPAHLGDPRFDDDIAGIGLWQPWRFMKEGYAGVYFLDKYDPGKTPVLFVHGINGSPRSFAMLAGSLDRSRFQPWVFYYPSGFELSAMGDGMFGLLSELHHRYGFNDLHIVAHSMGGLVSRGYLKTCAGTDTCRYLRSFISISSPFGGHEAARSGVDYAPAVIPVWRSMVPSSRFLRTLFAEPPPAGVAHHLLFGYRNNAVVGSGSSDGTVSLSSQLRPEAQNQAASVRGFDEDHMSILDAVEVLEYINRLLEAR